MTEVKPNPHCVVFDSGMGGLTIVDELIASGFKGRLSYIADTELFPYGNKSDSELTRRVPRVADAIMQYDPADIFVIACNTASTLTLPIVRATLSVPVIGTVPAIKPAAAMSKTGVIGVLATPGTLKRAYTDALIHEFARQHKVLSYGSVRLVELAERHAAGEAVSDEALLRELDGLMTQPGAKDLDVIVLACTHFPLLRTRLQSLLPDHVVLIDSGAAIAKRTLSVLGQVERGQSVLSQNVFYGTGSAPIPDRMREVSKTFGFSDWKNLMVEDS